VKNVLLVNALLSILFLSDTYGGRTHEKPIVDATPYPLPAGSRLLQDLGFLAFPLPEVAILMSRGRRKKRERGRGHYDKDRPAIIAWISRQGGVIVQATRDFTVKDGAAGRRPRYPSGKPAVHGLRQQLPRIEGLCTRVRQSYAEGIRAG
jgi:hypothetical protein